MSHNTFPQVPTLRFPQKGPFLRLTKTSVSEVPQKLPFLRYLYVITK